MSREEKAVGLFFEGFSCSQAVVCAFADVLNVDRSALLKLSSSFGGGMGRLREVCGAVTGMFMVAGLLSGSDDPKDREAKIAHYKLIQNLAAKFREEKGSIICRELLSLRAGESSPVPEERTADYYKRRPCAGCIGCAARILEETFDV